MSRPLTIKHKLFVKEYLTDFNASAAYIRAGYKASPAAGQAAHELLKKPEIQAALANELGAVMKKVDLTVDRVLDEFMKIAFSNLEDYITFGPDGIAVQALDKAGRDKLAAVSEVVLTTDPLGTTTTKFKLYNKMSALDSLGKYLQMFIEIKANIPIEATDSQVDAIRGKVMGDLEKLAERMAEPPKTIH